MFKFLSRAEPILYFSPKIQTEIHQIRELASSGRQKPFETSAVLRYCLSPLKRIFWREEDSDGMMDKEYLL